jgi:hypothetical protein
MNENIFTSLVIILSPILIFAWVNLLYLIFNRRKDANQELSVLALISLYLLSLVPIGVFVGYHLMYKKIKSTTEFKYSKNIRSNGSLILIIAIASIMFSLINLRK